LKSGCSDSDHADANSCRMSLPAVVELVMSTVCGVAAGSPVHAESERAAAASAAAYACCLRLALTRKTRPPMW